MSRVNILQCVINVGFVNNEFFSWFRVAKRVTTSPLLEDPKNLELEKMMKHKIF